MTFGEKIKDERKKLKKIQGDFSKIGGVSRRSQIDYEKDIATPSAAYLSAIEVAGADIFHILTGRHLPPFTHKTIVYVADDTVEVGAWSQEDLDLKVKQLIASYKDSSARVGGTEVSTPDEKPALSKDPATFAKELETALKLISEESARIGWQMPRSMQKGLATIAADGIDQALLIQLVKLLWTECEKEG